MISTLKIQQTSISVSGSVLSSSSGWFSISVPQTINESNLISYLIITSTIAEYRGNIIQLMYIRGGNAYFQYIRNTATSDGFNVLFRYLSNSI